MALSVDSVTAWLPQPVCGIPDQQTMRKPEREGLTDSKKFFLGESGGGCWRLKSGDFSYGCEPAGVGRAFLSKN